MPAIASLTLPNATPADVVFSVPSIDGNGLARWVKPESVLDARPVVTLSVRQAKPNSVVSRVNAKILQPVMDTVDTTKKIGENYVSMEFVFHKQSTSAQRLDLRAFAKNFLAHANMTAAVTDLEGIY